jgi:hypothetical protein
MDHPVIEQRGSVAKRAAAVIAMVMAAVVAACGSSGSEGEEPPVAFLLSDATSSFVDFSEDCVKDFMNVARATAERGGDLYAGPLVTGDPYRQPWTIEAHFEAASPSSIEGNRTLERAHRLRQVDRLEQRFGEMVQERAEIGGSPVLDALARVADFRTQRAADRPFSVLVCSDLANIDATLDTRREITPEQVGSAVDEWSRKLNALHGSDLYFVGVGRLRPGSKARPESIAQMKRVLRAVAERIGARVRVIDTQLGDQFPVS